jgi:hypothetical protein
MLGLAELRRIFGVKRRGWYSSRCRLSAPWQLPSPASGRSPSFACRPSLGLADALGGLTQPGGRRPRAPLRRRAISASGPHTA